MCSAPNVADYPTLDISRSMGRNRSLVNAYAEYILRFYPARWGPFSVVAEVSVEAGNLPSSNPAASQEDEHHTAQCGKSIPIQRHLKRRAQTAKLISTALENFRDFVSIGSPTGSWKLAVDRRQLLWGDSRRRVRSFGDQLGNPLCTSATQMFAQNPFDVFL